MNAIHKQVKSLIIEFRKELGGILSTKFHGLYLYNSVAMGNFDPEFSDIDFVVILKSQLTDEELDRLYDFHKKLGIEYAHGSKLEGMYLQYNSLGMLNSEMSKYPFVNDSILHREGYFDINYVTWWSLKEYEMPINSPSIKKELSEINFDNVLKTMNYNLNHYWLPKLNTPEIFEEDMWVEFSVVTLSRIIFTIREKSIVSKVGACRYMSEEFYKGKDIIDEALAIRNSKPRSVISDIIVRKNRTINFIESMINYGNRLLTEQGD